MSDVDTITYLWKYSSNNFFEICDENRRAQLGRGNDLFGVM
jgi:hypothetical protein